MALLNMVTGGGGGASSTFPAFTLPHAVVTSSNSQTWKKRFSRVSVFDSLNSTYASEEDSDGKRVELINRRQIILSSLGSLAGCLLNIASFSAAPPVAVAASSRSGFADMPAIRDKDYGKTKMRYADYTETETGLQFKDLRIGTGPIPQAGETVVVDWDGYTIGYYGRIFEARNKTKGGSFEGDDKDFFKFKIGSEEVIPAFEEAVSGMSLGGIRRIIVPPELGYPENDFNKKGPRPTTFSVVQNMAMLPLYILCRLVTDKVIYIGAKGIGFCAEEPRTNRQDSVV